MAEIIGEFGGMVGGGSLNGTPVTTSPFLGLVLDTTYGVPTTEWDTWTLDRRARYLTDYQRPKAQADYYKNQPLLTDIAYTYTGLVEQKILPTALPILDTAGEIGASVYDTGAKVVSTATDILPIVAILGALYLLGDR